MLLCPITNPFDAYLPNECVVTLLINAIKYTNDINTVYVAGNHADMKVASEKRTPCSVVSSSPTLILREIGCS